MGITWFKNNSGYISEGLEWCRFSTANAAGGIIEERLEKKMCSSLML